ncbi:MAG: FkbM family methyltransferase [Magnetococcus sp. XQGC-1]
MEGGKWEPNLFYLLEKFIVPNTTVLDVGAWIGGTALFCAHLAEKVYLFEPDVVALNILRGNLSLNPPLGSKMTLIEAGLGVADDFVPFYNNSLGNSGSSQLSFEYGKDGVGQKAAGHIRLIDARRFLSGLDMSKVSLIKMDIEGAEYDLIPYIAPLLEEYRPTLLLSLHPLKLGGKGSITEDRFYRFARSVAVFESLAHYPYIFHEENGKLGRRKDKEKVIHELKTTDIVSGSFAFSYSPGW